MSDQQLAMARVNTVARLCAVSKATVWRKVAAGQFPRPVKLSERITAWRMADVNAWLASKAQA